MRSSSCFASSDNGSGPSSARAHGETDTCRDFPPSASQALAFRPSSSLDGAPRHLDDSSGLSAGGGLLWVVDLSVAIAANCKSSAPPRAAPPWRTDDGSGLSSGDGPLWVVDASLAIAVECDLAAPPRAAPPWVVDDSSRFCADDGGPCTTCAWQRSPGG